MLLTAVIFFAIAALGGLVLASMRLADKPLPLGLAVIHGLAAVTGLVLLILFMLSLDEPGPMLWLALLLFLAAGAGGAIMFFGFHLRGKKLPIPLALLHAALAIGGLVVVLMVLLGTNRPATTQP